MKKRLALKISKKIIGITNKTPGYNYVKLKQYMKATSKLYDHHYLGVKKRKNINSFWCWKMYCKNKNIKHYKTNPF